MKKKIEELCDKANLTKPEMYTSFVWSRAFGDFKRSIADDLGISERTLRRWEIKTSEKLEGSERSELIALSVEHEYKTRILDKDEPVKSGKEGDIE